MGLWEGKLVLPAYKCNDNIIVLVARLRTSHETKQIIYRNLQYLTIMIIPVIIIILVLITILLNPKGMQLSICSCFTKTKPRPHLWKPSTLTTGLILLSLSLPPPPPDACICLPSQRSTALLVRTSSSFCDSSLSPTVLFNVLSLVVVETCFSIWVQPRKALLCPHSKRDFFKWVNGWRLMVRRSIQQVLGEHRMIHWLQMFGEAINLHH